MPSGMTSDGSPVAGYELLPHDADVWVQGHGPTMGSAFEQVALALTRVVTETEVSPDTKVEVSCSSADTELLLVDWLDAIIYEMSVRKMLFARYEVEIADNDLRGTLWGEPINVARHAPACEPKGADAHRGLGSRAADGLWYAGCVIDV